MNKQTEIGMNNQAKRSLILIMMVSIFSLNTIYAQYVGVNLKLNKERMMETILPFGFQAPLKTKSTTKQPEKESFLGKGVYAIGAHENVRVLVNMTYSEKLIDKQKLKIPFEVTMTYQNNGTKEEKSSLPVNGTSVDFMLNNSGRLIDVTKEKDNVLRAYVFLTGKIKTEENYKFPLKGEIMLNVEYE